MKTWISRIPLTLQERLLKIEWLWWQKHFKQSRRWPTIKGKDLGEAYKNGVKIRDWVMAGGAQKDHHRRKEDPADTPNNNSEFR
jgi:hypothetical protein